MARWRVVHGPTVNLRAAKTLNSAVVGTASKGDVLDGTLEADGKWVRLANGFCVVDLTSLQRPGLGRILEEATAEQHNDGPPGQECEHSHIEKIQLAPKSGVRSGLVLLHGYGSDAVDLVPFAQRLQKQVSSLAVLLPRGGVQLQAGRAWFEFDGDILKHRPNWSSMEGLLTQVAAFKREFQLNEVVVGGFSQGAVMSSFLTQCPRYLLLAAPPIRCLCREQCLFVHGSADAVFPIDALKNGIEGFSRSELIEHPGGHELTSLSQQDTAAISSFVSLGDGRSMAQLSAVMARADDDDIEDSGVIDTLCKPIEKFFDLPQLIGLLWPRGGFEERVWQGDGPRVVVFHGACDAHDIAERYADKGCYALHPAYKPSLHCVAATVDSAFDDVDFVHGVGAGTILALHLAALRNARKQPLRGLVLDAPVAELRDVPGAKGLFGCMSSDPTMHKAKLANCGCPVVAVRGADPASCSAAALALGLTVVGLSSLIDGHLDSAIQDLIDTCTVAHN